MVALFEPVFAPQARKLDLSMDGSLAEPAAWRAAADALAAQRPTLVPIAPMRSNVATARSSPPARLLAKACAASRAGTKFTGVMSVPFSAMWRSAAKPAAEASGWPALSASKEHTAFQLAAERMYAALAVTRPWTCTHATSSPQPRSGGSAQWPLSPARRRERSEPSESWKFGCLHAYRADVTPPAQ